MSAQAGGRRAAASIADMVLDILYLGSISGTALDRANAFRRMGHRVDHVDPRKLLPETVWLDRFMWRMGGDWLGPLVHARLRQRLGNSRFDLCFVDGGSLVTPRVVGLLREHARAVVNYSIDDPLGPRDGARSRAYRQSLPFYDLCIVMRPRNVLEAQTLGAKDVMRVFMSADEVSHAPRVLSAKDREQWQTDVLFVGSWFPERGAFFLSLIERGIPLTIRGANWHKAPEWPRLAAYWKGGPIVGDDYAKAIQCAKINLGLLSKGNRDLHTTRSLEIPALGGLLCAERTVEHLSMYEEGREALFWDDAEECAAKCRSVLHDEARRHEIARAGQARAHKNAHFNERVLSAIISQVLES